MITKTTTKKTIQNIKQQLTTVNNDINSQIDTLLYDTTTDHDKTLLYEIRDKNIETINLINTMELQRRIE